MKRNTPTLTPTPTLTLGTDLLDAIDPRIFGQFLERAGWRGEMGPEAAMHPTQPRLREEVLDLLRRDTPPIARFPGGNDVDRTDWRELVDGAHPDSARPGMGPRPATQTVKGNMSTTRFGYDEFLRLSEEVGFEPLLVLNFGSALLKKMPADSVAERAAALVRYATAPRPADPTSADAFLPKLRGINGHPEPYGVPWVQIGNETWWPHKVKHVQDAIGSDEREDYLHHYRECLHAYLRAIRRVNPDVPIIMDGVCGLGIEEEILRDPYVREHITAVALHFYSPWSFDELNLEGERLPVDAIDHDTWWRLLASCPGTCDADGLNVGWRDEELALYRELGLKVAVTEWNWFGHEGRGGSPDIDLAPAMVTGAANFLNGLIRRSDLVTLGCQSMLMGIAWNITGIRVNPEGDRPPYYYPQYQTTTTYGRYCGSHRLDCHLNGVGGYEQPYATGNGMARPHAHVSWIDAVATTTPRTDGRHDSTLFLVNRHRDQPVTLRVEPGPLHQGPLRVVQHDLVCLPPDERSRKYDAARVLDGDERTTTGGFEVTIPPRRWRSWRWARQARDCPAATERAGFEPAIQC